MDGFDAMHAFARVVEAGSFTNAAETLRIGRTSVTQPGAVAKPFGA